MVLIKLWQIPGPLKIFFFIGGLTYMSCAILALVLTILNGDNGFDPKGFVPLVPFYVGIIIEQICFGFALGYFTDQLNQKYRLTMTQNLNLKNEHNQKLTHKLEAQSKRLKQLAQDAKERKVALVKSEYEAKLNESRLSSLQSKMNPHFIFNALNSIKAYLIENDKRKAVDYMNRFSKLIRKILESSRIESISLEEELDILKLYIEIENTRFNNELFYSIENTVNPNNLNIKIPPLILQPFIENAIWHGLAPSEKNKKLHIKISENQNFVEVEIEDNGVGREQSFLSKKSKLKKKSMGMKMTKERLKVFNEKFEKNHHFKIHDKQQPETGTVVTVFFNIY
jgi:sensor histidine kinase YesM